jgi:hypothetical protein
VSVTGGNSGGHTMIELMVACALLLVIMGALALVAIPAHDAFRVQPEAADLQQRMRVAVDALHRDLATAGAGFTVGPAPGPLNFVAPPVLPYRFGVAGSGADAPGSFRPDAISILALSSASVQCLTDQTLPAPTSPIPVRPVPGCPLGDPLCGFAPGMVALAASDHGTWDAFLVSSVLPGGGLLEHAGDRLSSNYAAGSAVGALQIRVYYLRTDPSTGTPQLTRSDGARSDLPICDHVVGLRFELFGAAAPPALIRPAADPIGPWTSYGPRPPPIGVQDEATTWPPGENCVFSVSGGQQVARLPSLTAAGGTLARLDGSMLVDGPWCPDPNSPNRYDADLLRVRLVRVALRVEAASDLLRGRAGPWFLRPGSSTGAGRFLPDQLITFDVAPRNLTGGQRP